ncbi:MAG TPA: amidase [Pseudomonas sp.]|nr:amidase [Pseudomonas sp.]
MIKRRPFLSVFLLLLLGLALLGWSNREHLAAFPGIVGAYSAKEYCSCRYVAAAPADYCLAYVKQYLPLDGFFDDAEHKRVTARGLGSSQTAAWLGQRDGCQLQPQADPLP